MSTVIINLLMLLLPLINLFLLDLHLRIKNMSSAKIKD